MTILGISGKRNIPNIKKQLTELIVSLKPKKILSGMAIGTDLLVAEIAVELDIKFDAIVPFQDQERCYDANDKIKYRNLIKKASEVIVVSGEGFANWKYQKRNEYIVNNCEKLLVIWDGIEKGGTWNCLNYAQKKNKDITIYKI